MLRSDGVTAVAVFFMDKIWCFGRIMYQSTAVEQVWDEFRAKIQSIQF